MQTPLLEALEQEIRDDLEGAIVTNAIFVVEFFDPNENQKMLVTFGAGADGSQIAPWLASGMLEAACQSELRLSFPRGDEDEVGEPEDE